jgi:hypothetical protein
VGADVEADDVTVFLLGQGATLFPQSFIVTCVGAASGDGEGAGAAAAGTTGDDGAAAGGGALSMGATGRSGCFA